MSASSIDYAALAADVKAIIEANGRSITIRQRSTTPADPDKPWGADDGSNGDHTVTGVCDEFHYREIDGTNVKFGDKKYYVAATSDANVDPSIEDQVIDGSKTYKIVGAVNITPGATSLLYILHVRA